MFSHRYTWIGHIMLMCGLQAMLNHWTKKIIVEEGHTVAQLVHILYVSILLVLIINISYYCTIINIDIITYK